MQLIKSSSRSNLRQAHRHFTRCGAVAALALLLVAEPAAVHAQTQRDSAEFVESQAMAAYRAGTREDLERAVGLWSLAVTLYRSAGDRAGEATTLNNIGFVHDGLGRPDSALAYYAQALPIQRAVGNRAGEATTLSNIGVVHGSLGRPDSALAYYTQALPIMRAVGDRAGEAVTLSNIGFVHARLGRPDSALAYFAQALPIQRAVGDRAGEATTLGNIRAVHSGLGRPDSALAYYAQALPILRAAGDRAGEARTLNNIGMVHYALGRPDSALAYFAQALPIRRAVGDRVGEARTLNNIGMVHERVGRPDSAFAYYTQALPIEGAVGDRAGEAATLNNIGMVHERVGRPDSALAYFAQALPILRAMGDRAGEAATLNNIGLVHSGWGRPDSALAYYAQALPIRRAVGDRAGEAVTLSNIAYVHQYTLSPPRPHLAIAYYDSATVALGAVAERAGGDENRLSYAEQNTSIFSDWTLAWLARLPEIGPTPSFFGALAAADRGRAQALLELMRRSAADAGTTVGARAAATAPGADLVQEGRRLATAISGSGTAALVYLVTADTLLVWLIGPDGNVEIVRSEVDEEELAEEVAAFRGSLGADAAAVRAGLALRDTPELERQQRGFEANDATSVGASAAAARRLAERLIPPALAARLPPGGELIIVPHASLNLVPFAALPADPTGEPLGVRYGIRYAPSLSTLAEMASSGARRAAASRATPLVVGNPAMPTVRSYSGAEITLGPLAGAEAEGRWVAARLATTMLSGATATERVVKERLPGASLVHLATHGYAYSSEARARDSFIALAPTSGEDGLLTVGEVLDDLPSLSAELVVLSACQTGLGDLKQAEGTVGLQRAFLAKGARSVLVSLWSVSDEATEQLMRSFYRHWLDGAPKVEALRMAQLEVRGESGSRFHDPRYWAAFQLVGAD